MRQISNCCFFILQTFAVCVYRLRDLIYEKVFLVKQNVSGKKELLFEPKVFVCCHRLTWIQLSGWGAELGVSGYSEGHIWSS